jgi:hypothetical protein
MPVGNPDPVRVELVGSLSVNFHARDRLSCAHDGLKNFFDLIGDLRNRLANRAPDMVGDRRYRKSQSDVD